MTICFVSNLKGVSQEDLSWNQFCNHAICLTTNPHIYKSSMYSDQWRETWTIKVLALKTVGWIACSAMAFWCFTLRLILHLEIIMECINSENSIITVYRVVLAAAISQSHSSNHILAMIVSLAPKDTWNLTHVIPVARSRDYYHGIYHEHPHD